MSGRRLSTCPCSVIRVVVSWPFMVPTDALDGAVGSWIDGSETIAVGVGLETGGSEAGGWCPMVVGNELAVS